jgi:hypothetical protein
MFLALQKPPGMFAEYTITRSEAGSYVDGRWDAGSTSTITVTASVQPGKPTQDELLKLPAGDRNRASVRIYTDSLLRTADESQGLIADFLTWAGEQWEVMLLDTWGHGIAHYKGLAMRVSRQ